MSVSGAAYDRHRGAEHEPAAVERDDVEHAGICRETILVKSLGRGVVGKLDADAGIALVIGDYAGMLHLGVVELQQFEIDGDEKVGRRDGFSRLSIGDLVDTPEAVDLAVVRGAAAGGEAEGEESEYENR